MNEDIHSYRHAEGHGLAHDPFNAIVGPRPIGWISSVDPEGRRNLAPYSFFNAFNYHPPIVGFCSVGYKDSVRNIEATGEFGWNLATATLAAAMNASSATVAPGVDEFGLAGLTPVDSLLIAVPRVGESPVSFECKLTQMLRLEGADGRPVDSWMMFGEVVAVHIAKAAIKNGVYDTAAAEPILRGGGSGDYFRITQDRKFVMPRPR